MVGSGTGQGWGQTRLLHWTGLITLDRAGYLEQGWLPWTPWTGLVTLVTLDRTHSYLGQDWEVELSSWRDIVGAEHERRLGGGERVFAIELCRQVIPILQTDLEYLLLVHF